MLCVGVRAQLKGFGLFALLLALALPLLPRLAPTVSAVTFFGLAYTAISEGLNPSPLLIIMALFSILAALLAVLIPRL